MSPLKKTAEKTWKSYVPKTLLISYIVLSALFILLSFYNFLKVGVYQAGFNQAVGTIAQQSATCQPVPLDAQTQVINLACLQNPTQESPNENPVEQ